MLKKYTNPCSYTDSEGKTFYREEPDGWMIECGNHNWSRDSKDVDVASDLAFYSWGTSEENKNALINAWNQRAERTCKVVRRDRDEYGEFAEYSCGHANVWQSWNEPKFCCWCGARVEGD